MLICSLNLDYLLPISTVGSEFECMTYSKWASKAIAILNSHLVSRYTEVILDCTLLVFTTSLGRTVVEPRQA